MGIAAQIVRMLGGPSARLDAVSFPHPQHGTDAAYRDALGCPVYFEQPRAGFELSAELAIRRNENADPLDTTYRHRIPRGDISSGHCDTVRPRGRAGTPTATHRAVHRRSDRR